MMLEKQNELFAEWKDENPNIISDGVVNEPEYLNAPIKVLYLLKEANGGSGWDLCEFVARGGRPQTWNNLTRWTKGIFNINR